MFNYNQKRISFIFTSFFIIVYFLLFLLLLNNNLFSYELNLENLKKNLLGKWSFSERGGAITLEFLINNKWHEEIIQFSFADGYQEDVVSDLEGNYEIIKKDENYYLILYTSNHRIYKEGRIYLKSLRKFYFKNNKYNRDITN